MASAQLRQRTKEEEEKERKINNDMNSSTTKMPKKKSAIAKRGLRSLAIAISLPLTLTLLNITFFSSTKSFNISKPSYLIPIWALHLASLCSAMLMGFSAWLVWAEGGFHRKPEALMVYLGQVGLSLAWGPVVFGLGASRVGLVVCVGLVGALVGCSRMFRVVNPVAGQLVKPWFQLTCCCY
ncbi:hypothetical protein Leryth_005545 [Lithospermum erythrorhizon]|nr:hypothetical protein Leryth_005545 [Lithospermum erythrorhizon]